MKKTQEVQGGFTYDSRNGAQLQNIHLTLNKIECIGFSRNKEADYELILRSGNAQIILDYGAVNPVALQALIDTLQHMLHTVVNTDVPLAYEYSDTETTKTLTTEKVLLECTSLTEQEEAMIQEGREENIRRYKEHYGTEPDEHDLASHIFYSLTNLPSQPNFVKIPPIAPRYINKTNHWRK